MLHEMRTPPSRFCVKPTEGGEPVQVRGLCRLASCLLLLTQTPLCN